MVYVGQMEVYGKGVEVLSKLAQVEVCDAQLYRVTDAYGGLLEEQQPAIPVEISEEPVGEHEVVYAQLDGSMIFTETAWQEVKVGRVFREKDCVLSDSENRHGSIRQSHYAAYLGHYQAFCERLRPLLEPYVKLNENLVFITDGALWIRNWLSEHYPLARQILDFYHVKEHLSTFADVAKLQGAEKHQWLEKQSERLKQGQLPKVLDAIRSITLPTPAQRKDQERLLNYLQDNAYRMHYDQYIDYGLFIGSGAIEAAHRTVVQSRLKLSGQRWSNNGAQNMLNLRVACMSNQWHRLVNLIQNSTAQAA